MLYFLYLKESGSFLLILPHICSILVKNGEESNKEDTDN